ncbi:hypothetical protein K9B35_19655 [Sphingomonas sp. R647]|uniref:hypothetical protein n=1 Tax=Sphingomonas sp. R647 TaxID=2875233 RepID=UPI001CD3DEF7|nr:hypothetical protein [Sphingomonas sp. R647]MCA1200190.1 hypothetical protein [Sphingomonas sp. R647]
MDDSKIDAASRAGYANTGTADSGAQSSPKKPTEHAAASDAQNPQHTPDSVPQSEGVQPPEDVEDRPMVGSVTPDDYPKDMPDH